MNRGRFTTRALVLVTALAAISCIDGREEVWLEADGSGRAEIAYSLPAVAARLQGGEAGIAKLIDGFLKGTPAIKTSTHEVTAKDDRLTVLVKVSFDSASELGGVSKSPAIEKLPAAATGLTGVINVDMHGRTVDLSRTINAGRALPGSTFMPASQFDGRSLEYIVHLPRPAEESNASRIENAGKTLIWNFPLSQVIQGPVTIRFKASVPIPRWIIGSVVGVALAAAFVLVRAIWKRQQRPVGLE